MYEELSNLELSNLIKDKIKDVVKDCSNNYLKHNYIDLYNEIEKRTLFLNKFKKYRKSHGKTILRDISLFERLYCLEHNLTDRPKCIQCGEKYVSWSTHQLNEYSRFCCTKCAKQNPDVQRKQKQTCLNKYGVEHSTQSKEVRQKTIETCLKKYGGMAPSTSTIVQDKMRKTNLERYGVENAMQNPTIREKTYITNEKRYGNKYLTKNKTLINKVKGTYAKKMFDKLSLNKKCVPMFVEDDIVNIYSNATNSNERLPLMFKCVDCNNVFDVYLNKNFLTYKHFVSCPICCPPKEGTSKYEKEIVDFLQDIYSGEIIKNSREIILPYELDIYIPEKKLAIEFNGLYWHSEVEKPKNYHLLKTEMCEKQGIKLIHIFENEWVNKQVVVKQYLKSLFGIYDKTIYARQCIVKEIDNKTSRKFIDEYHLQGKSNATKLSVGLFYENELVSCMTFCKPKANKQCEWELSRFVCKSGYHIPGAASKLLIYFERNYNPISLVSYADRRWSYLHKNLYLTLNFKLSKIVPPDYKYFHRSNNYLDLKHKSNFRKSKIKSMYPLQYNPQLSEHENMLKLNYLRIYDSGHLTYIKDY